MHVRINLQSGLTEAKLLDEQSNNQAVSYNSNDNIVPVDENVFHSKDLEEALKNIKPDEPISQEDNSKEFRTYEEIKKDLDELKITAKSDVEILRQLITNHNEIITSKNYIEEELLIILEDLEYLVHQYDNAKEFINLNGFKEVVYKHLNNTNVSLKLESLKLLGSSMQNNPKIQIHAIETGAIDILLRMLSLDNSFVVKNRVMYALGTLLRRFPLAQIKFLSNAGLSIFANLLESDDIKIQIKIVTLLNDLLLEHINSLNDIDNEQYENKLNQYKQVNLKQKLLDNNFCIYINNLLKNVITIDKKDYDSIEKTFQLLDSLIDSCSSHIDENLVNMISLIKTDLMIILQEKKEDGYYLELYELVNKIFKRVKYREKEL